MNVSKKNMRSTFRWLSDAAVDAVDNKKIIHIPIFFLYFAVDTVDI